MRIGQVNVYFHPLMVGGIEWYIFYLSKELVRRGHEVHVFTTLQKGTDPESVIEGIHVHRLPLLASFSYRVKIWPSLTSVLKKSNLDVIHVYDYAQFHSFAAVEAKKDTKIPAVITVFDIHSLIPRPFYKQLPLIVYDRFFSRWLFRAMDKILVRTPNLTSHLIRFGAPEEKITVTPSGIPKEALYPADGRRFREKYGIDGPLVLFVGRLHPTKGLQHLIKATSIMLKEIPTMKIVIIGPDQVGFKKVLVRLAEDLGVRESILFPGAYYDFREKMQAYAACEVFVLPSGYEGFGQVLIEAMAQGKPIVTTNVGGIPSIVNDGREGILVNYGDSNALAQAVLTLLWDKELVVTMGERGRKKAAAFTYEVLVDQIEKIYASIGGKN